MLGSGKSGVGSHCVVLLLEEEYEAEVRRVAPPIVARRVCENVVLSLQFEPPPLLLEEITERLRILGAAALEAERRAVVVRR